MAEIIGTITYQEHREARSRDFKALEKAKQREKETEHLYKWEYTSLGLVRRRIKDEGT